MHTCLYSSDGGVCILIFTDLREVYVCLSLIIIS